MVTRTQGIIIIQTPFRISFFGGGTDFPDFFNEHEGCVLGTAIDKYMYVTLNSLERFLDKRIRLSYAKLETVDHQDELEHQIARTILHEHPFFKGDSFVDINTFADLPAASGMGSSSTFTVGMLNALYLINGIYRSAEEIAKEAIVIERDKLKEAGGWQDQIFAAYGGFNKIYFSKNRFTVEPVCIEAEKKRALESACLLFFTGGTRSSQQIQQHMTGSLDTAKISNLKQLKNSVLEAEYILRRSKNSNELIHEFGLLLNAAWQTKRNLDKAISDERIDMLYQKALAAGAIGGKLCGAGGGGFLLMITPSKARPAVLAALSECKVLPIQFEEWGSRPIYSKYLNNNSSQILNNSDFSKNFELEFIS